MNPIGYELGAVRMQDTFQHGMPANAEQNQEVSRIQ